MEEVQALKDQHRVLEEWDGAFQKYRGEVLDAFKAVYAPLREELHKRSEDAAAAISGMPEYQGLTMGDRTLVRTEYRCQR